MTGVSAIYEGSVMHARFRPKQHRLRYRVFSLLLDLDELPALDTHLRLFGHNRAALFSFHDSDHGEGMRGTLRAWIERQLADAGVGTTDPRIEVLCYPRILGYVFNPLTVYFCRDRHDSRLLAILYEVSNTYGERHTYVIAAAEGGGTIRQSAPKRHYVSPFMGMDCRYDFRIVPPGGHVTIGIDESDADGRLLVASFTGERRPLTDRGLLGMFLKHPLMTLKVTAAIHWEALRLFVKGVPTFGHAPAASRVARTIVARPRRKHAARRSKPEPVGE